MCKNEPEFNEDYNDDYLYPDATSYPSYPENIHIEYSSEKEYTTSFSESEYSSYQFYSSDYGPDDYTTSDYTRYYNRKRRDVPSYTNSICNCKLQPEVTKPEVTPEPEVESTLASRIAQTESTTWEPEIQEPEVTVTMYSELQHGPETTEMEPETTSSPDYGNVTPEMVVPDVVYFIPEDAELNSEHSGKSRKIEPEEESDGNSGAESTTTWEPEILEPEMTVTMYSEYRYITAASEETPETKPKTETPETKHKVIAYDPFGYPLCHPDYKNWVDKIGRNCEYYSKNHSCSMFTARQYTSLWYRRKRFQLFGRFENGGFSALNCPQCGCFDRE